MHQFLIVMPRMRAKKEPPMNLGKWRAFRTGRFGRAAPGVRGVKADGELLVLDNQVVDGSKE